MGCVCHIDPLPFQLREALKPFEGNGNTLRSCKEGCADKTGVLPRDYGNLQATERCSSDCVWPPKRRFPDGSWAIEWRATGKPAPVARVD